MRAKMKRYNEWILKNILWECKSRAIIFNPYWYLLEVQPPPPSSPSAHYLNKIDEKKNFGIIQKLLYQVPKWQTMTILNSKFKIADLHYLQIWQFYPISNLKTKILLKGEPRERNIGKYCAHYAKHLNFQWSAAERCNYKQYYICEESSKKVWQEKEICKER